MPYAASSMPARSSETRWTPALGRVTVGGMDIELRPLTPYVATTALGLATAALVIASLGSLCWAWHCRATGR